jgi:hypothetical protein
MAERLQKATVMPAGKELMRAIDTSVRITDTSVGYQCRVSWI